MDTTLRIIRTVFLSKYSRATNVTRMNVQTTKSNQQEST